MRYLAASDTSPVIPVLGVVAYGLGIAVIIYLWRIRKSYVDEGKRVAKLLRKSREAQSSMHVKTEYEERQSYAAEQDAEAYLDDVPISAIAASDEARNEWLKRLNEKSQTTSNGGTVQP